MPPVYSRGNEFSMVMVVVVIAFKLIHIGGRPLAGTVYVNGSLLFLSFFVRSICEQDFDFPCSKRKMTARD